MHRDYRQILSPLFAVLVVAVNFVIAMPCGQ